MSKSFVFQGRDGEDQKTDPTHSHHRNSRSSRRIGTFLQGLQSKSVDIVIILFASYSKFFFSFFITIRNQHLVINHTIDECIFHHVRSQSTNIKKFSIYQINYTIIGNSSPIPSKSKSLIDRKILRDSPVNVEEEEEEEYRIRKRTGCCGSTIEIRGRKDKWPRNKCARAPRANVKIVVVGKERGRA